MKKQVLGIKIDDITMHEAVETVEDWLSKPGKHFIVTPNPEIIVAAQNDFSFKIALNKADLSIPDGMGLQLSAQVRNKVAGIDLMEKLVELASEKGFTIGLLGGKGRVAKIVAECLKKKYPKLKVTFAQSGGEVDMNGKSLKSLKSLKTDFLFVAFGPPKQEKWIAKNLGKLDIKVAMGVGGAFDYLSGQIPRAPKLLRNIGCEWLFRLMVQPWRIKRQLALFKYILLLTKK